MKGFCFLASTASTLPKGARVELLDDWLTRTHRLPNNGTWMLKGCKDKITTWRAPWETSGRDFPAGQEKCQLRKKLSRTTTTK